MSDTQAIFAIAETAESGTPPYNTGPYVKLVTLTFDTGAFSVLKQSSTFTSSDYYNSDSDEYGLVFFKYVDSGSLDNLYIATIGLGLDDSS